ncbi:MAG: sterol desaturase family protein [Bacteroidetes bacterium]|nr:sterol desaturase family protein [Bacteroidota bacterium]
MGIIIKIFVLLGAFCFMEFVAWFTHKFIMHGLLWNIHKGHHTGEEGVFEKNDLFFLFFAIPSFILIFWGALNNFDLRVYIGAGIALYGLAYFIVHDVFIHQRIKIFRNSNNIYLKALRRAHKMHHKHITKEKGESFGMLIVSLKYLKQELKK